MLHYTINRPIGATRGESDLTPVLPWAKRYAEWLKDRVRLNRIRTRQAILHLRISDPALVEQKRQQIRTDNPIEKGIYVSGPDEELIFEALQIQADQAEDDGRALRLAIATAGNVGLHYLGEGQSVNYATAKEMGEPTARFYVDRQQHLIEALKDLVATAYRRYLVTTGHPSPQRAKLSQANRRLAAQPLSRETSSPTTSGREGDLQLQATAAEVARADNESLAAAARDVVQALAQMRALGWVDDHTAARLAFKFAGEPLGQQEIDRILAQASSAGPPSPPSPPRGPGEG